MPHKDGSKSGGRQKGSRNKVTLKLKNAILQAFDNVGGMNYLEKVAKDDPRTFCTLLGKVLPAEVKADLTVSRTLVKIKDLTGASGVIIDQKPGLLDDKRH